MKTEILNILNYNLNRSQLRSTYFQFLIDNLYEKTNSSIEELTMKIDMLFNIKDVHSRQSAFYSIFLLMPDSSIKKIFTPSYLSTMPYDDTILDIKNKIYQLFKGDTVLKTCPKDSLNRSIDWIYSFTTVPTLDEDRIGLEMLRKSLYLRLKQDCVQVAVKIDDRLKSLI